MNLYVGNLSPETSENDLNTLFSEFGEIASVKIIRDPETGLPRGFGFVEMTDKFSGFDAIDNIDSTFFQGHIITVKEAKPKNGAPGKRNFSPRKPFNKRFDNNRSSDNFNRFDNNNRSDNHNRFDPNR